MSRFNHSYNSCKSLIGYNFYVFEYVNHCTWFISCYFCAKMNCIFNNKWWYSSAKYFGSLLYEAIRSHSFNNMSRIFNTINNLTVSILKKGRP